MRASRGAISVTGVRSKISTPRSRTVWARPRASLAGWIRAQCGLQIALTAPATRRRSSRSAGSSSRTSSSVQPQWRSWASNRRSRRSWAALVATVVTPPLTMSASMPSSAATAMTSSIASNITRCSRLAASAPCVLA